MDQSYEVTARKYRPQTFAEVVGQEHITQTLQNALKTGQIAHAYLFAGPRGTGKTTTARLLAKSLNCRSSDTMVPEPCGECESCLAITRGLSIDVLEIDGASNRGIDQIRELREAIGYASFEGRYKVYVIDEVHMLTNEAFNALLKTLEEPPGHVVFVFATTQPSKVIPTILSRVQRYDFRRIGIKAITDTLMMIAEREEISAEREALHLIAGKAEGALRDAESLLDQVRAFAGNEITLEAARTALGVVDSDRFFELTRISSEKDAAAALRLAATLIEEGQDPREFMLGYGEHLRYLIMVTIGGEASLDNLLEKEKKRYLECSGLFDLEDYLRRLDMVSKAAHLLRESPQPWITLEAVFLRLVLMDRSVDLSALLERIERSLSSAPHADPPAPPEQPDRSDNPASGSGKTTPGTTADSDLPPPDVYEADMESRPSGQEGGYRGKAGVTVDESTLSSEVDRKWNDIIEEVRRRKVSLAAFLAEAKLKGVEKNKLVLAFRGENYNFHINMVNRHLNIIRDVTRDILGHAYGVNCIKIDEFEGRNGERGSRKNVDVNEELLERLCEKDPDLKKIVDIFNARLEDGSGGQKLDSTHPETPDGY